MKKVYKISYESARDLLLEDKFFQFLGVGLPNTFISGIEQACRILRKLNPAYDIELIESSMNKETVQTEEEFQVRSCPRRFQNEVECEHVTFAQRVTYLLQKADMFTMTSHEQLAKSLCLHTISYLQLTTSLRKQSHGRSHSYDERDTTSSVFCK